MKNGSKFTLERKVTLQAKKNLLLNPGVHHKKDIRSYYFDYTNREVSSSFLSCKNSVSKFTIFNIYKYSLFIFYYYEKSQ